MCQRQTGIRVPCHHQPSLRCGFEPPERSAVPSTGKQDIFIAPPLDSWHEYIYQQLCASSACLCLSPVLVNRRTSTLLFFYRSLRDEVERQFLPSGLPKGANMEINSVNIIFFGGPSLTAPSKWPHSECLKLHNSS
jgi:hypothetical protein